MTAEIRRKLERAARVREFVRARAGTHPDYALVLTRLDALLQRAETIAARQHGGLVAARAARAGREALRRRMHAQVVRYVVVLGSAAGRGNAELAVHFRRPATNSSTATFLVAVKAIVAQADAARARLAAVGMDPDSLVALLQMIDALEAAGEAQRTARRDHIGATADLRIVAAQLTLEIDVVDGITRYRFGDDRTIMAEWQAAKRVPGTSFPASSVPSSPPSPLAVPEKEERRAVAV